MAKFDDDIKGLRQTPLAEQTEHTSRAFLEALLSSYAHATDNAAAAHGNTVRFGAAA